MASKKYPDCQWELSQIRIFVSQAKSRVGEEGWRFLSPQMREGIIAQMVLDIMYTNWRVESGTAVDIKVFLNLHKALRAEAGLIDEDEE